MARPARTGSSRRWTAAADARALAGAGGLSVVAWVLDGVTYWAVAQSLGIDLTPAGAMFVAAITVLGHGDPVGARLRRHVRARGIGRGPEPRASPPEPALAFALLVHALTVLPLAIGGAASLVWIGARFGELVDADDRPQPAAEPGHGSARMTDAATPELSIVLPVYNEGEAVEPVLRALSAGVRTPHELVVVYDFDGDTTVPVVARLAAEIPGLRGLRNDLGRGVLNAMKAGIAGTTRAVRPDLDGRRLRRAARSSTRWSSWPGPAPTSSPPAATCAAVARSADRRSSG